MKITIDRVRGMARRPAKHLLGEAVGQAAQNLDVATGAFVPLRDLLVVEQLAAASVTGFFKWAPSSAEHWIAGSVGYDSCASPVAGDTYKRRYYTGDTEARFFANDNVSNPFAPATDYLKLGVPAPTAALTASGYSSNGGYRAYVYTYVNRYGEEGPPSPLLEVSDYGSGNVTLAGFSTAPTTRAIQAVRVYRVNSSAAEVAEFQLVFATDLMIYSATVTYNNGDLVVYNGALFKCVQNNTKGVTPAGAAAEWDAWYDGIADSDLQPDVLVSADWEPPPSGLQGLVALPNGSLAGFVGNVVYVSEPGYPHAWPQGSYSDDFTQTLNFPLVALSVSGTALVAMTTAKTYILDGSSPDLMRPRELEGFYPCVSKPSVTQTPAGVLYAAAEGLVRATPDGLENTTAALATPEQWAEAYAPATLRGRYVDGRYIGFHSTGGVVVDYQNQALVDLSVRARAVFLDDDGTFYVAADQEVDPNNPPAAVPVEVKLWAADTVNYLYASWKSRMYLLPAAVNFAAARVTIDEEFYADWLERVGDNEAILDYNEAIFDAGGILGGLAGHGLDVYGLNGDALRSASNVKAGGAVRLRFYADAVLRKEKTVTDARPFRLPAGFRARRFEVELSGYLAWRTVELATSVEELWQ